MVFGLPRDVGPDRASAASGSATPPASSSSAVPPAGAERAIVVGLDGVTAVFAPGVVDVVDAGGVVDAGDAGDVGAPVGGAPVVNREPVLALRATDGAASACGAERVTVVGAVVAECADSRSGSGAVPPVCEVRRRPGAMSGDTALGAWARAIRPS